MFCCSNLEVKVTVAYGACSFLMWVGGKKV